MIPNLPAALETPPAGITCIICSAVNLQPAQHQLKRYNYNTGEALSSDTCGPFPTPLNKGSRVFMTGIHTNSRYLIITFLKTRDETAQQMDNFLQQIQKDKTHT